MANPRPAGNLGLVRMCSNVEANEACQHIFTPDAIIKLYNFLSDYARDYGVKAPLDSELLSTGAKAWGNYFLSFAPIKITTNQPKADEAKKIIENYVLEDPFTKEKVSKYNMTAFVVFQIYRKLRELSLTLPNASNYIPGTGSRVRWQIDLALDHYAQQLEEKNIPIEGDGLAEIMKGSVHQASTLAGHPVRKYSSM